MAVLNLKKEIDLDGKKVKEIEYDIENLSGADLQRAVKELGMKGIAVTIAETDQNYHAMLFAIGADMAYEDMMRLGAKDYVNACNIVRDFFLEE